MIQNSSNKTIMVTNPNMKEGESTIVFRFALGFAQNQLKVMVMDDDLHRPEQYKLFDRTAEHGLSDVLSGEVESLKGTIYKDVRPGLDLLPNITESDDPIDWLQSPCWKSLFQSIAEYDGVIIVAQWGHTTRSDLQSVCGILESINSRILGMVVNQMQRSATGSYYSNIGHSYRQPEKTIPNSPLGN